MSSRAPLWLSLLGAATACTNFMVSPGASKDGTLASYSCDGPPFATLIHLQAQAQPSTRELNRSGCSNIGKKRADIAMKNSTFNVIGLTNEHAVSIGETTFGGNYSLKGTGLLTYYDVMEMTLQTSKSAREAISTIDALIREYGYG